MNATLTPTATPGQKTAYLIGKAWHAACAATDTNVRMNDIYDSMVCQSPKKGLIEATARYGRFFRESSRFAELVAEIGEMPDRLDADEQSTFWIGYYHEHGARS